MAPLPMSSSKQITVRDYCAATDLNQLRLCVVELQDFERDMDHRMPTGDSIADEYISQLISRCGKYAGKIIVAETHDTVAGYVCIWNRVATEELDEGEFEYAYVADLIVREQYRGKGIGRILLEAAESNASESQAKYLRIGVLTKNKLAHDLYLSMGFANHSAELEKNLEVP